MRSALTTLTLLHFLMAGLVWSQATDIIETSDLGDRGVVFESPFSNADVLDSLGDAMGVGDTNGDGLADILLVVQEKPDGNPNPYVVLLIRGREGLVGRHTLLDDLAGATVFRPPTELRRPIPEVPGPVGDVDGDGLADFFFSFPHHPGLANEAAGAGFLIFGARDLEGEHALDEVGTAVRGAVFTSSDPGHEWIGKSFARPGDLNGDGRIDLVLAAPSSTNFKGQTRAGIVFVFFDAANLLPIVDLAEVGRSLPGVQIHGNPFVRSPEDAARMGSATAGILGGDLKAAGDFDGDGLADLLMTELANVRDLGPIAASSVHIFRGRASLPPVIDMAEWESLENLTTFRGYPDGFAPLQVAGVGDLDGDSRSEILIGFSRRTYDPTVSGESATFLLRGVKDFSKEIDLSKRPELDFAATTFHPLGDVDGFGGMIEPAGDLNGDHIPDLFFGLSSATVRSKESVGEAYVIFGKRDYGQDVFLAKGFDGIRIFGENTRNGLGGRASPAGDFNGDGADDILVLARHFAPPEDHSRVYVIYGTGSGPAPLRLYRTEPASGPLRGGTVLKLKGSGYTGIVAEPRVLVDGNPSSSVRVVSGSKLRVVTPPGDTIGPVDVMLVAGGETRTLQAGYEYTPDFPEIDLADLGGRGFILEGEGEARPGFAVAFGDLTGDGVAELAVGSRTPGGWVVTVVRGGSGLPAKLPAFTPLARSSLITSAQPVEGSATRVAFLGDVNGDGVGDLGIGLDDRLAYVLFGRASFPEATTIEDEFFEQRAVRLEASGSPSSVALARMGDLTGDGIADFAVALPGSWSSAPEAGEIIVVAGRKVWPDGFDLGAPALALARIQGSRDSERLGDELATAGDVNGDGALDLTAATPGGNGAGHAYILFGGPGMPVDLDAESYVLSGGGVRIDLEDGFEHFSWLHVASAGDTNADGFDDVLLGVEDGGVSTQGVTYLVRGGASLPASLKLVEKPAAPDGITRFFGASPMVQAGRIAPAGDFNADGRDDFLIAQQPDAPTGGSPWKLVLMLGGEDLPSAIDLDRLGGRGLEVPGPNTTQVFLPAREAGDLNGDGQPDFAVTAGAGAFDGTPGRVYVVFGAYGGTTFRRGDANFDGRIEISDAIYALGYLFLGGEAPRCADAVDADDDGKMTLTDAVYLLNHLFTGGLEPPAPYPGEGKDPTDDNLDCRGF